MEKMKLIREHGMIYAPVAHDFLDDGTSTTLLCEHNEHGEAVVPRGPGEDLDMCLYSLRNSNTEAGKLPDGTEVELDGVVLGHFESFHFIPTRVICASCKGKFKDPDGYTCERCGGNGYEITHI